jgi:hypothetical protein
MGREIRRVPKDWVHPMKLMERWVPGVGTQMVEDHIPMHEHFPYNEEEIQEGLRDGWLTGGPPFYGMDVMPQWTDAERTHLMMYEDTSEGTPISPAFETPEELARWLADTGASANGGSTATYEQWLATCRRGWAPSMIGYAGHIVSGVEGMTQIGSPPSGEAK